MTHPPDTVRDVHAAPSAGDAAHARVRTVQGDKIARFRQYIDTVAVAEARRRHAPPRQAEGPRCRGRGTQHDPGGYAPMMLCNAPGEGDLANSVSNAARVSRSSLFGANRSLESAPFTTLLPARLERSPWRRFRTLAVAALGITWILDGLEVPFAGSIASASMVSPALRFNDADVGAAGGA